MTSLTMPAPELLQPPPGSPPIDPHGHRDRDRPAPSSTILAALARLTSHAGDPLTLTVTEPGHLITVTVADRPAHDMWRAAVELAGSPINNTNWFDTNGTAWLHGWSLSVRIAGPAT